MTRTRSFLIPGSFLAISLLAACATSTPPGTAADQPDSVRALDTALPGGKDTIGRIGPDGGPLLVDRGIGGTGAPASAALQVVERGIGGTGIVGVVTGFGSVFVDGIEIRYDDKAPVDIDGAASSTAALRVGQLVAIQADGPAASPYARAISVRSAVSGRIEALELGTGMLTIGGQAVLVPDGTWGANRFALGDWVKVSGLRQADGTIVASRLDAAPAGVLTARGRVERDGDVVRVGNLVLPEPMAAVVKDGQFVVVSGDYAAGHGRVGTIAPDTLLPNPGDYFGKAASRLVVQAFVQVDKGSVSMNGLKVSAGAIVSGQARHDGIAVVSMERGADGSYSAVDLHYAGYHGQTDQPLRRGTTTRTSGASAMSQRNARANLALLSQPDSANNGSTAGGHLAASIASDLDSLTGSPGSAISSVGTPSAIVSDPVVTPATPDPSTMPGIRDVGPSLKTTPSQPSIPLSAIPPSNPLPPAVAPSITLGQAPPPPIIPPPVIPPAAPVPPAPPVAPPTGPPTVESLGGNSSSGQLISSSTSGSGAIQPAAQREHHWASRHMHGSPSAVTLRGAAGGSTINEITTAVTTVTTTGGRAGGTSTANTSSPAAVSKPATTIGTTSGRSFGGSAGRRQGH